MNGATSPAGDPHPGEIVFEDKIEGRNWTEQAADNSQAVAWVEANGRWRPVVRVVLAGNHAWMEITKFGPGDDALEHTITG